VLGGTAAAISKTIAAPIERVKLLLQNQKGSKTITKPYDGIMDAFRRVPQEQGVMSLWRGNWANVLRYFPTQALNFMFRDIYKAWFGVPKTASFGKRLGSNIASGGAAGATSLVVVYPLDFARTRLATDVGTKGSREFTGTLDCILKTAKGSGWGKGGVYNGFTVSLVGIVFYRGAYFGLWDMFGDMPQFRKSNLFVKFCVGYGVTVAAGLLSYPLDTVRRRMMMESGGKALFNGGLDCFRKIVATEGVGSLYRGAGANVARGLAGALVLIGFDWSKNKYLEFKYPELKGKLQTQLSYA